MFTGIVSEIGTVSSLKDHLLTVECSSEFLKGVQLGDSIAVDGVCLTVVAIGTDQTSVSFNLGEETLNITTLGLLSRQSHTNRVNRVNLERAAMIGDRVSGHTVEGHCDGTGTINIKEELAETACLKLGIHLFDPAHFRMLVKKGFIAIDGISLTINEIVDTAQLLFVTLVPHTINHTTLGEKVVGDYVNFEIDIATKRHWAFFEQQMNQEKKTKNNHQTESKKEEAEQEEQKEIKQKPHAQKPTFPVKSAKTEYHESIQNGTGVVQAYRGTRVCIVSTEWNRSIVDSLKSAAIEKLIELGVKPYNIATCVVPGAFELPFAVQKIDQENENDDQAFDAFIALGCVIRGSTPHFEYVCSNASNGLMKVGLKINKPVVFGVLTCDNEMQAKIRAGLAEEDDDDEGHEEKEANTLNHNLGNDYAVCAIKMSQTRARPFAKKKAAPKNDNAFDLCFMFFFVLMVGSAVVLFNQ